MFIACLWGIETPIINNCSEICVTFIACLWGIETWWHLQILSILKNVYRVPMRNWNELQKFVFHPSFWFIACLWGIETVYFFLDFLEIRCLSRAYEELKQGKKVVCWSACCFVYRVPMRNWNSLFFFRLSWNSLFIACLWGIETINQHC